MDAPAVRMRARRRKHASDADMVMLLNSALDSLTLCECSFWACDGPNRPRPMITCSKCWAVRKIATVRATLAARIERS